MLLVLLFFFNLSSAPAFPVESTTAIPQQQALTQQQAMLLTPINDQRDKHLTGLLIDGPRQLSGVPLPAPRVTGRGVLENEARNVPPLARLLLRTQSASSDL